MDALTNTRSEKPALRQVLCSTSLSEPIDGEARRLLTPAIVDQLSAALAEAESALCPAPRELILKGLTTALALVAPAGFSEQDRKLWLAVALETLKELPSDLLQRGIIHARLVADHPSKVVPAVVSEIGSEWTRRKRDKNHVLRLIRLSQMPEPEAPAPESAEPFTVEEIRAMTPDFRRIALGKGWLTQEQIDAASS